MPTIRIDDDVYTWLKTKAVPFDDTPNSVLRRMAGLDKKSILSGGKSGAEKENIEKMETSLVGNVIPDHPAKFLARKWRVNVVHALYHKDGTYYHHLCDFPAALFDPNGFVIFYTEKEYINSPYLQHGVELHVPNGIALIPGYKKMN
jgi:hypothetical protein